MAEEKVLIVDDDRDIRLGLNARFRARGFETVFAEDCVSAVSVARKERPHVILLDIGLPAGDGFVVLERLKINSETAHIPVIVLTARDPEQNEKRAQQGGAFAFVQKPYDADDLITLVRQAVS